MLNQAGLALSLTHIGRGFCRVLSKAEFGVEPRDVVVEADRMPVDSQQELDKVYRRSRDRFSITVRDFRTGRDVLVKVEAYAGKQDPEMRSGPRSLGVTSKLVFCGGW
jgi:hypothetical protein